MNTTKEDLQTMNRTEIVIPSLSKKRCAFCKHFSPKTSDCELYSEKIKNPNGTDPQLVKCRKENSYKLHDNLGCHKCYKPISNDDNKCRECGATIIAGNNILALILAFVGLAAFATIGIWFLVDVLKLGGNILAKGFMMIFSLTIAKVIFSKFRKRQTLVRFD
jgi:hypothetical protein